MFLLGYHVVLAVKAVLRWVEPFARPCARSTSAAQRRDSRSPYGLSAYFRVAIKNSRNASHRHRSRQRKAAVTPGAYLGLRIRFAERSGR
jgi:hypothetical protein